jgi:hypothetical protein
LFFRVGRGVLAGAEVTERDEWQCGDFELWVFGI